MSNYGRIMAKLWQLFLNPINKKAKKKYIVKIHSPRLWPGKNILTLHLLCIYKKKN